jgi:hypothetical protein
MTCYHFQKKIKACIEGKQQDQLIKELISEINYKMA